ncbi:sulfite exporter TauE/SafE family protein [Kiritimatiellaeota bacterium B1221]|nr:sulfite exporter TauE/SafE family protein [Kiritimatiellaeota bacterium B1221]
MISMISMGEALTLGAITSLHCMGMCGPLALALPANKKASKFRHVLGRLVYNLGRAVTYACMGIFAGVLGKRIQLYDLQNTVSILFGVLLLASLFLSAKHMPAWVIRFFYKPIQQGLGRILKRGSIVGLFQIGLLNGLLPCGMVYAALALASLQTGAISGAVFMFLFGLGTLPLMFALSLGGLSLRAPKLQPVLNRIIPTVTFLVAVLLILRGLSLNIPFISPPDLSTAGGACCH